jgi:hypothetical protein
VHARRRHHEVSALVQRLERLDRLGRELPPDERAALGERVGVVSRSEA